VSVHKYLNFFFKPRIY